MKKHLDSQRKISVLSHRIDSDPEKRVQWRKIPCDGEIPTPEEWVRYTVEQLTEEGQEHLLRRYLNL